MKQGQVQIQQQVERQLLKLAPQQIMVARLLELPIVELEEQVKSEVYDNMALEEGRDNETDADEEDGYDEEDSSDSSDGSDEDLYAEDDISVYAPSSGRSTDEEIPIGDTKSFIEELKRQIYDFDLTEHQQELIEYLIGTLDNNGFIDRPLTGIVDDLLFNFNIETDTDELDTVLKVLQKFEPAGIGARNLQECLTIQIDRKLADAGGERKTRLELEREIVQNNLDLLQRQKTEQLANALSVSVMSVEKALEGISRLNPRPGLALCESSEDRAQTIVPDFIIETSPEGNISVELNNGEVPELRVSAEYSSQLKAYQINEGKMSRTQQQAFEYTRQKVERAKMFIDSIKQRQRTLYDIIQAIVKFQHDFILSQDETQLCPMRLIDIAEYTKLDISTVSRVRKSKYALIDNQIYPLDYFFLRARSNADGEALEHKEIKQSIKDLIDGEDKMQPLSDRKIVELLSARNQKISRRTVAKYRGEMGIQSTTERKDI